jgi:hypothetical protein
LQSKEENDMIDSLTTRQNLFKNPERVHPSVAMEVLE